MSFGVFALAAGELKVMHIYKVKRGDTIESVASVFGVLGSELARINNVKEIREGERLIIFPKALETHRVKVNESTKDIADKYGITEAELLKLNMCDSVFPGMKVVVKR